MVQHFCFVIHRCSFPTSRLRQQAFLCGFGGGRSSERPLEKWGQKREFGSRSSFRAAKTENSVPWVVLCSETTRKRLLRRLSNKHRIGFISKLNKILSMLFLQAGQDGKRSSCAQSSYTKKTKRALSTTKEEKEELVVACCAPLNLL